MAHTNNETTNREIVITRLLNAPQALVYEAWTDPKHVINWWGPDGFTNTFHKMEVKPGGVWDFIMHGPDGVGYPNRIVFSEVVKPERLAYLHGSGEENGPNQFEVVVTFEAQGDKTMLTMRSIFATQAARDFVVREHMAIEGGNQTVNRLEEYLKAMGTGAIEIHRDKNKLKISRLINAHRDLVFDAWVKPEHIKHWWGPNDFTNTISEMDVRAGGKWELVMHGPDGTDYKNSSIYVAVVPSNKIVFDHVSGPKYRMEVTFEEQGNATLLTIQMAFESEGQLDSVIKTFRADEGLKQNIERLETYLNSNKMDTPLIVERTYNAPIEMVWGALTNADEIRKWYFDIAEFKPQVGFEFSFEAGSEEKQYKHLCRIVEVVPGSKVAYTWQYDGYAGSSVVSFELFKEGDKTRVRLTHEGIESMAANGPDFQRSSFMGGWSYFVDKALKEYVETKAAS